MIVRTPGHDREAPLHHDGGESAGIVEYAADVQLELRTERLAEGHRLGGDDMHERAALEAGEHGRIDATGEFLVVGEDEPAPRPAQRLVGRAGDHMGMREGRRMQTGGDDARDMGHVDHEPGTDGVRDLAEAGKVDDARVGRGAGDDELGAMLLGEPRDLLVVDASILAPDTVMNRPEPFARERRPGAMGEVPAGGEVHAQDRIARLQQREHDRPVRLCARVRLHVREAAAEETGRPLDREPFGNVHELAAAVVAPAGVSLGVFVREHRTLRLEHRAAYDVLARDQLDALALAPQFRDDGLMDLGVTGRERFGEESAVRRRLVLSHSPLRHRELLGKGGVDGTASAR